jgi:hypothetical protein
MAANVVLDSKHILNVLQRVRLRSVLACGLARETTRLGASGGWAGENDHHVEQPENHLS